MTSEQKAACDEFLLSQMGDEPTPEYVLAAALGVSRLPGLPDWRGFIPHIASQRLQSMRRNKRIRRVRLTQNTSGGWVRREESQG